MSKLALLRFPMFLCVACLVTVKAHGQTERVDLFIDDPRPVAQAVSSFIERYPVVITYEDPRYEYADDIQDITERLRLRPANGARSLVPRGGMLQTSYDVALDTGQPVSFASAIDAILEVKNVNPVGGRFAVEQTGDVVHVVPAEVRDKAGRWVAQHSILDVPITISTDELNGIELMEEIAKKVSEANGVTVASSPQRVMGDLFRHKGRVEANNEPARDVLLRTLHSISERITWLLFYDPTGKYYVFNITVVAEQPPKEIPLDLSIIPRPGDPFLLNATELTQ